MEAFFVKLPNGTLMPASDHDRELLSKIKAGQPVKLKLTRVRNYDFHRKFFALMNFAYDYWDADERDKNFDRFRKDIIILAGYFERFTRLNGDERLEAKSIAFHNMSEDDFEKLYSKCIDVIIKYICTQYTGDMLRDTVAMAEEFA